MFYNHNIGLPQPTRFVREVPVEPEDCCSKWCRVFCIAFTLTGFISCLVSALYFLYVLDTSYFPYFLLAATICLGVFIHLITVDHPFRFGGSTPRITLDTENIRLRPIPRSTVSLPAYIVVQPSELGENESLGGSTESTLSAEEIREGMEVEAAGSSRKAEVKTLDPEELGEATEAVVKVVDETLKGVGGAEAAGEGSSKLAEGARRLVLQGMRHRKQSPKESQKNVPSSEDEKNE